MRRRVSGESGFGRPGDGPTPPIADLDPRVVGAAERIAIWDEGFAACVSDRHRWRIASLLLSAICGAVLGFALAASVNAAPRSAANVIPAADMGLVSGNLSQPSGAPLDLSPMAGPSEVPPAAAAAGEPSGAPAPSAGIGEPLAAQAGTATWCAPTPTRCQSWGGDAHVAGQREFTYGDRPYAVTVRYVDANGHRRSTTVWVVSYCACPNTLIDLSPAAFTDLAPLSLGRIDVTVEDAGPGLTPPATDVEP